MEPTESESLGFIAKELQSLIDRQVRCVLALVVGSTGSAPGKVGAKMIVLSDGSIRGTVGGGVVEAQVIKDARKALKEGEGPRQVEYRLEELGMSCGGKMSVYLEPLQAPKQVILFGGGHVAAAVARVVKTLGCAITVVDEREEWANLERFPDASHIVNRSFDEQLSRNPPGPQDHVIIVTRGHDHDQLVLEGCIERRPAYLGMIGSKSKAAKALQALRAKGVAEELVRKVRCPIGLDIGAVTPAEIAISIAAELVRLWRRPEFFERSEADSMSLSSRPKADRA